MTSRRLCRQVGLALLLCFIATGNLMLSGCGGGEQETASEYETGDDESGEGGGSSASGESADNGTGNSGDGSTSSGLNPADSNASNGSPYSPTGNGLSSAGTGNNNSGGGNPFGGGEPIKPPTLPGNLLDRTTYEVPVNGTRNDLQAFLQRMFELQQQTTTNEDSIKINQAIIQAAELLYIPGSDEMARVESIELKIGAMQRLFVLEAPNARENLETYCADLMADDNPSLQAMGAVFDLSLLTRDYFVGETESFDDVQQAFTELVKNHNNNSQVFLRSQELIEGLVGMGMTEQAQILLSQAAQSFMVSSNPQIAESAKTMVDQLRLLQLNYNEFRNRVFESEEGAAAQLVEASRRAFGADEPSAYMYSEVRASARMLEILHYLPEALELYDLLESVGLRHSNPQIMAVAKIATTNARERIALINQPLPITGNLMNGEPFDPTPYQGKYILLFFWSTRWQDSLASFGDFERVIAEYREYGVEVIGVNLDEDRQQVEPFLSQYPLPWVNIRTEDEGLVGVQTPLADRCGTDTLPFVVLIDPNGIAIDIHLYQDRLFNRLDGLFGIVRETPEAPDQNSQPPETGEQGLGEQGSGE